MNTAKIIIEVPYNELGLFVGSLPSKTRKQLFSMIEKDFDFEILGMATKQPRKRLCSKMELIAKAPAPITTANNLQQSMYSHDGSYTGLGEEPAPPPS